MKHVVEVLSVANPSSSLSTGDRGRLVRAVESANGQPKSLKIDWESGIEEDLVIGQHEFKIHWVTSDTETLDSDLIQRISFATDHPEFALSYPVSQADAAVALMNEIIREKFWRWKLDYGSLEFVDQIDNQAVDQNHIWTLLKSGYAINGYLTEQNRNFAEAQSEVLGRDDEIAGFFLRGDESNYELFNYWIQTEISFECGACLEAWTKDEICKVCQGEEFVIVKLYEEISDED
jgi:hypothetical protein